MSRIKLGIASPTLPTSSICFIGLLGVPELIRVVLSGGRAGVKLGDNEGELANGDVELDNDDVELRWPAKQTRVCFAFTALTSVGSPIVAFSSSFLAASSRPSHGCA